MENNICPVPPPIRFTSFRRCEDVAGTVFCCLSTEHFRNSPPTPSPMVLLRQVTPTSTVHSMILDTKDVLWMMILKVLNPTEQDRMKGPENSPNVPLDRFPLTSLLRTLFAYLHLAFFKRSASDEKTEQELDTIALDVHRCWRTAIDHFTSIRDAVRAWPTLSSTTLTHEQCRRWMETLRPALRYYAEAVFDCQLFEGRFRDGTARSPVIVFSDVLCGETPENTVKIRRRVILALFHAALVPRKPHVSTNLRGRIQAFITTGSSFRDGSRLI